MINNKDVDFKSHDTLNLIGEVPENLEMKEELSSSEIISDIDEVLILKLKEENALLNEQIEEYRNKMLRVAADAQNSTKQNQLDILYSNKSAKKGIVKNLLPFLTAIQLSFPFFPENPDSIKIKEQLLKSMTKLNEDVQSQSVSFIIPSIGDEFDPKIMQALNTPEDTSKTLVKNIASIGCIIDGDIIQPASVII